MRGTVERGPNNSDFALVGLSIVLAIIAFLVIGYGMGEDRTQERINSGETLLRECQQTVTTKIVDGVPVQEDAWYCKIGE